MIASIALTIVLAQGTLFHQEAKHEPISAPQIICEIGVVSWCIAGFNGSIDMKDDHDQRVWMLQQATGMEAGPLVIVEEKSCDIPSDYKARLGNSGEIKLLNGKRYESTRYNLTTLGCSLEFFWPEGAKDKSAYRQTMLYGILFGTDKRQQLYKLGEV